MSELYSHLHEELQQRLDEAEKIGYGFTLPKIVDAPLILMIPKLHENSAVERAA